MARVGVKDEPITYDDVKGVLDASQTVVLNSLDATCSRVAALSLASIDAFGLPVCTNAYATGAGAATSAPPHTDKQRVLVFQCFGRKHWRVWRPPDQSKRPETDPLARGKGTDVLAFDEFDDEPVLDVTLRPGDVLYVPAGWPHTTDTLDCATDDRCEEGGGGGTGTVTVGTFGNRALQSTEIALVVILSPIVLHFTRTGELTYQEIINEMMEFAT